MASTYNNLKIELMATGDQPGIWGVTTDQNLNAVQQAIGGLASVVYTADTNKTLQYLNSSTEQDFRAMALYLTSTIPLTATRTLVVPAVQKLYLVKNATTGNQSITVKIGASTGVTIPNGYTQLLYADGSDVVVTTTADAYFQFVQSTMSASADSSYITNTTTVQSTIATNGVAPAGGDPTLTTSIALVPEGYGALLASKPDNTAVGGNGRGAYSVDLQMKRAAATQVAATDFSVVCGGENNTNRANHGFLGGGISNTLGNQLNPTLYSSIVGGYSNVNNGEYSFIGGGYGNSIGSYLTSYGTINGGYSNSMGSDCTYGTIGGGYTNSIVGGASGGGSATIGGGSNNTITGTGSLGTIGGGSRNSATNGAIPGGASASDRGFGHAYGFGSFSAGVAGTAQTVEYVCRVATSNGTATRITSTGSASSSTNNIVLPNNAAYLVQGTVIAINTATNDVKTWKFEGAIKRGANAAATALMSAITPSVVAADGGASAWSIAVSADTTYGALAVDATGAAATSIRWVMRVRSTEVTLG